MKVEIELADLVKLKTTLDLVLGMNRQLNLEKRRTAELVHTLYPLLDSNCKKRERIVKELFALYPEHDGDWPEDPRLKEMERELEDDKESD